MRALVLLLVGCALALGACVAETDPADSTGETAGGKGDDAAERTGTSIEGETTRADVCALAAALAEDDICRHACDPEAFAAQLIADGTERGACYSLSCTLSVTEHVIVGVCLAP